MAMDLENKTVKYPLKLRPVARKSLRI